MAYEWLNTIGNIADTVGNVGNALSPFLRIGGSIYDRNNTRGAINSAFDQYAGYANRSLDTLRGTYNEGRGALRPYLQAGRRGVAKYQNLLRDPNQITNDPGYQFRLDQGAEGMRRQLAAGGFRGSGRSAIELTKYGQDYASNEFDKALARYLPMVQTGVTATGRLTDLGRNYAYGVGQINNALGEAAAGREIGNAGADSRMVTDFLGMTGGSDNPFGAAADVARGAQTAADLASGYNALANAGGGSATAAVGESVRQAGTGTWADPFTGARTFARMPTTAATAAGTGAATWGTMTALGTEVGPGMYMAADGLVTQLGATGAAQAAGASTWGAQLATAAPYLAAAAVGIYAATKIFGKGDKSSMGMASGNPQLFDAGGGPLPFANGAFGPVGMSAKYAKKVDQAPWRPVFQAVAQFDNRIAARLTPQEVNRVKRELRGQDIPISLNQEKVGGPAEQMMHHRLQAVIKAIGPQRARELGLSTVQNFNRLRGR